MPCYSCGARQTDPERGPSPWQRGIREGRQVLVCPDCQRGADWTAALDHCAGCGSARLKLTLGELRCGDCGRLEEVASAGPASPASGLAEEVAAAVARVLGRPG